MNLIRRPDFIHHAVRPVGVRVHIVYRKNPGSRIKGTGRTRGYVNRGYAGGGVNRGFAGRGGFEGHSGFEGHGGYGGGHG